MLALSHPFELADLHTSPEHDLEVELNLVTSLDDFPLPLSALQCAIPSGLPASPVSCVSCVSCDSPVSLPTPRLDELDFAETKSEPDESAPSHSSGDQIFSQPAQGTRRIRRDSWSDEDYLLLVERVRKYGFRWRRISGLFKGRSEDSVRQAWCRRFGAYAKTRAGPLGPTGKRPHWTPEEDADLRRGMDRFGKAWSTIRSTSGLRHSAQALKGRAYRLGLV